MILSTTHSSPPSLNAVPRDRRLPSLASLLDSEAMKNRWQARLFSSADDPSPWLIRSCEPIQVRYTPESSCLISYRLTIEHQATGERDEQVLCGRAFPVGRSRTSGRPGAPAVRLTAQATMIPVRPAATLHGELHATHVVLTEETIALIDLNHVCKGHPGQDLGRFIAGLLTWGVARQASLPQIASHAQIFLDQYHQEVPWKVGPPVVAWFIALALVIEHSYRCVTQLTSGRREMMDQLLNLANEISKSRSLDAVAYGRTETRRGSRTP